MFVAYFGGFKPPHKGHLAVVEEYLSMPDVLSVYVVYGNKSTETQAEVFDNEEDAYAHLDFVKQKYKVAYLL